MSIKNLFKFLTWKDFSFLFSFFNISEKLRSAGGGSGGNEGWPGADGHRCGSALKGRSVSAMLGHLFTSSSGTSSSSWSSQRDIGDSAPASDFSRSHALPGDHIWRFLVDKFSGNSSSSVNKQTCIVRFVLLAFMYPKVGRIQSDVFETTYEICTGVLLFADWLRQCLLKYVVVLFSNLILYQTSSSRAIEFLIILSRYDIKWDFIPLIPPCIY